MKTTVKVSDMAEDDGKKLRESRPAGQPGWPMWILIKTLRLLVLTLVWAGLGMGAGLFCGIAVVMVSALLTHRTPDMTEAYRHGAIPAAIGAGSVALLWNLIRTIQEASTRLESSGRERS